MGRKGQNIRRRGKRETPNQENLFLPAHPLVPNPLVSVENRASKMVHTRVHRPISSPEGLQLAEWLIEPSLPEMPIEETACLWFDREQEFWKDRPATSLHSGEIEHCSCEPSPSDPVFLSSVACVQVQSDLATDAVVHDLVVLRGVRPVVKVYVVGHGQLKSLGQSLCQVVCSLTEVVYLARSVVAEV